MMVESIVPSEEGTLTTEARRETVASMGFTYLEGGGL